MAFHTGKNIILLGTRLGVYFAEWIGRAITSLDPSICVAYVAGNKNELTDFLAANPALRPENTIIHARKAHPTAQWMRQLVALENDGYRVINKTKTLKLTADAINGSVAMYEAGLPHPQSWAGWGSQASINTPERTQRLATTVALIQDIFARHTDWPMLIVKPQTSIAQGAHVQQLFRSDSSDHILCKLEHIPSRRTVIQEYIDYQAIYRVITIDGKALPLSFQDVPSQDKWRVSVCLNENMAFVPQPENELLALAEQTQKVIDGEINFIDVYGTHNGYVLSEINTACSLKRHSRMAKAGGHAYWNIAHHIADYLVRQFYPFRPD